MVILSKDRTKAIAREHSREKTRVARTERRKQRHNYWRCFWTRPLGHKYLLLEGKGFRCVSCERPYGTDD